MLFATGEKSIHLQKEIFLCNSVIKGYRLRWTRAHKREGVRPSLSWKSLQQSIEGDIKSFTLQYIDWEHPENNVYHVTEEFSVERAGSKEEYRPDIVLL